MFLMKVKFTKKKKQIARLGKKSVVDEIIHGDVNYRSENNVTC